MPETTEVTEVTDAPAVQKATDFQAWERASTRSRVEDGETETARVDAPAAVEAEAEKPEAAASDEDEDEAAPISKGVQKRFNKLTRQKGELQGKVEFLEKQLAERNAPAKPEAPTEAKPSAQADAGEPNAESFDTYEAYVKALVKFERTQERAAETRDASAAAAAKGHGERLAAAREKYADFDDVVIKGGAQVPISQAMHEVIVSSERGPDVAYFLANNLPDAARIAKLPPFLAAKELGKIEAALDAGDDDAAEEKKAAAISKAPKPPKPVGGSSAADLSKEPDPKDFLKWNKWKDRQEALDT